MSFQNRIVSMIQSRIAVALNPHDYPDERLFELGESVENAFESLDEVTKVLFKQIIREIARVHSWPFKPNSFSAIELGPGNRTELLELIIESGNNAVGIGADFFTSPPLPPYLRSAHDYNDFLREQPDESVDVIYGRNSFLPAYFYTRGVNLEGVAQAYFGNMVRVLKKDGRLILYFDEGIGDLLGHKLTKHDERILNVSYGKALQNLDAKEYNLRFVKDFQDNMRKLGLRNLRQYQFPVTKRLLEAWKTEQGKEAHWYKIGRTIAGTIEVYQKVQITSVQ